MIKAYKGVTPTIADSAFIEDTAVIVGDVVIEADSSVWFHSVVRGDVNYIRIGRRTNVQDLSLLHVTHDTYPLILGDDVTVGHHVVLHGCT
ncbi:MAG: gamma carbonic anhydrase family protein, partial [Nitrospira sp.]|nr:gamma carbonic anhydrase family protein [Nitrospira sp.]